MHVYKELSFAGDKHSLDTFCLQIYNFFPSVWTKPKSSRFQENYIAADYNGDLAPHAEVSIYYNSESWDGGLIKVGNIVPLDKDQLTIDEYNRILDLFYEDIVIPYNRKHPEIEVYGPTSDMFDPLNYITDSALKKLAQFCNGANKSTGSSHPCDEERWFEFICQTVDDNKVFDYDTLYKFLIDEDYWGRKNPDYLGVKGQYAWSEEKAYELASEYEKSVRLLEFYKKTRED